MAIFMIATIKENDKIIGLRLLDTQSKKTVDASYESVLGKIKSGTVKVENLIVSKGELKGVNGSIDRYGVAGVSQSCTILNAIANEKGEVLGYTVSDANGCIKKLSRDNIVGVAEVLGIANGKVVDKNGTKFISAIEGEYPTETVSERNEKSKAVENKVKSTEKDGSYKIENGIILDADTNEPICEQGEIRLNKIITYKYGKYVVAWRYESVNRCGYKIYIYDVKKDHFFEPISLPALLNCCTITPDGILVYGMRTGGYGQFYESYILMIEEKTLNYKLIKSNKIINRLKPMQSLEGQTLVYDVAPSDIGAFSKGLPVLRVYTVDFDDFELYLEFEVFGQKHKYSDVNWVQWEGNPFEELCICAKVKDQLMLYKDGMSAIVPLTDKELNTLEGYNTFKGISFNPNKTIVALSNGNKMANIIAEKTPDRGVVKRLVLED